MCGEVLFAGCWVLGATSARKWWFAESVYLVELLFKVATNQNRSPSIVCCLLYLSVQREMAA